LPRALTFRLARATEIGDVARLVSHSFPGPTRPLEWLREQLAAPRFGGGPETLVVAEDAGRIVAACQVHPLRQWIGGVEFPCAGIGTVAVSPAHRRRKVGAELVAAALEHAAQRGDIVSALYPFRVSFYQSLGYGQAGEAHQYQVPPRMLPDAPERERVELLEDEGGRAEALGFYNQWAATQNGQLTRNPRMWAEHVMKHDRALAGYRDERGALRGYALALYRADLPPAGRYLEVDEMAWTTPDARRGLMAWIASLGDQWNQVLVRGLPSQRLADWIREPRLPVGSAPAWQLWAPAATLMAGTMFRILHMQHAWERRRVPAGTSLDVTFHVDDGQLPSNSGSWHVTSDGAVIRARRDEATSSSPGAGAPPRPAMRLDISTLSRIYAGALSPSAAVAANLAECDTPGALPLLDRALALPEPWTFERF
jgi:predicted acetyltransferase